MQGGLVTQSPYSSCSYQPGTHLAPVEGGGGPVDGVHLGDGGPRVSGALAGAVSHQGSVVGCGLYIYLYCTVIPMTYDPWCDCLALP